jgi:hypothetical protein
MPGPAPLLVRLVKDWQGRELGRQTPGAGWAWEGIQFTREPVEECDYLVSLDNRTSTDTVVRCPPGNVWALLQEPYVPGLHDWMLEGHEGYARVLTHHRPSEDPRYVRAQPAAQWLVDRSFDELVSQAGPPEKVRGVSCVTSALAYFPGHRRRLAFLEHLRQHRAPVDLFGRGIRPIPDKWDALAPYRYSLALENTRARDYWTEKLADCFLAWTVPIYHGCPNLEDYFPAAAFIRIDIERPAEALDTIRSVIAADDWPARRAGVAEARALVLHRYQLFPYLASFIRAHDSGPPGARAGRELVRLPAYRRRRYVHRARYLRHRLLRGELPALWTGRLTGIWRRQSGGGP